MSGRRSQERKSGEAAVKGARMATDRVKAPTGWRREHEPS